MTALQAILAGIVAPICTIVGVPALFLWLARRADRRFDYFNEREPCSDYDGEAQ